MCFVVYMYVYMINTRTTHIVNIIHDKDNILDVKHMPPETTCNNLINQPHKSPTITIADPPCFGISYLFASHTYWG